MKMKTNQISGFERDSTEKGPTPFPSREGSFCEDAVSKNSLTGEGDAKRREGSIPGETRRRILPYNPILKQRAKELRANMTLSEVLLWNHLKNRQIHGFDFDRQRPIDQYIADFYCKDLILAIEVDGSSHDGEEAGKIDLNHLEYVFYALMIMM